MGLFENTQYNCTYTVTAKKSKNRHARAVHVSTARESEMCYSLDTRQCSIGGVTRLDVAIVVRFSLYIYMADLEVFYCRYVC